ncbi:MAG TPA: hypothetical protein PKL65_09850 [Bacteroidales bacterium]|mgnify:FL=1|jgi:hypothetical protein|nr:hypothetical protein [Bacteroidales bacterium]HNR42525.1 hypothetical protein [Bacteroidales bacterium]HPM17969.1 hypothetical protein [Bacteroidales bacterium]HQG76227.1 hypothetical protein [Bacteroidales bacterium]
MKDLKVFLIPVLILLFTANNLSAQKSEGEKDFRFTIKTNPLSALGGPFWVIVVPLTGEYKAFFEAKVSEKTSIQVGAGYIGPSVLLNLDKITSQDESEGIQGIKTGGFRVQGMFKYFLSRDLSAPEGFYIGPHASYASVEIKNKQNDVEKIKASKLNLNGIFGYQLITSGGFALDVYTGLGFVSRNWDLQGSDWDEDVFKNRIGVNVPFGFTFGYAF